MVPTLAEHAVAEMKKKPLLVILIALNAIVLLGQIWPDGAPPFARVVNILFLCMSMAWFASALLGGQPEQGQSGR